jgi:hypothetical protein
LALRLFLLTSQRAATRLTEIFDFVWPTATAIWNLRWQVAGLVNAVPNISEQELAGRFVAGSGIHGANIRRACTKLSWSDQQQEFSRFLLFEICALYETWCEGTLEELGASPEISKEFQFPTSTLRGITRGISHAAYSSDREQSFHAMVNGVWIEQLESQFLR